MTTTQVAPEEEYLREVLEDASCISEQDLIEIPKSIHTGEAFLIWLNN